MLAGFLPWILEAAILASLYLWQEEVKAQGLLSAFEELMGRRNELTGDYRLEAENGAPHRQLKNRKGHKSCPQKVVGQLIQHPNLPYDAGPLETRLFREVSVS